MASDLDDETERTRQMWMERLEKNELIFTQSIDAPMEVVVELDGSVLIKYPFQLANFEKAGLGSIKFSALAARALKAVLNASERVKPVELGATGSRPIH